MNCICSSYSHANQHINIYWLTVLAGGYLSSLSSKHKRKYCENITLKTATFDKHRDCNNDAINHLINQSRYILALQNIQQTIPITFNRLSAYTSKQSWNIGDHDVCRIIFIINLKVITSKIKVQLTPPFFNFRK